MIKIAKTTLSQADINNLDSTPIKVLGAPSDGFCHVILGITNRLTVNTTPYFSPTIMHYYPNGLPDSDMFTDSVMIGGSSDYSTPAQKKYDTQSTWVITDSLKVKADTPQVVGDGTIDVYVVYEEKLIE